MIQKARVDDHASSPVWPKPIREGVGGIRLIDNKQGIWGARNDVRYLVSLSLAKHLAERLESLRRARARLERPVGRGRKRFVVICLVQPRRLQLTLHRERGYGPFQLPQRVLDPDVPPVSGRYDARVVVLPCEDVADGLVPPRTGELLGDGVFLFRREKDEPPPVHYK